MYQLDVRTVVLVNFLYGLAFTTFLLYYGRRRVFRLPGIEAWGFGFLFVSLNFLTISLRNFIPLNLSNILPHLFMISGLLLVKRGLSQFYKVPLRIIVDLSYLVSLIVLFLVFSSHGIRVRATLSIFGVAGTLILTLAMLRREQGSLNLRLFYWVALILQVPRFILMILLEPNTDPMLAGTNLAVVSMLMFLTMIMIILALVFITVNRLLGDKETMLQRVSELSVTDELTGLMNRRGFKGVYMVEEKRILRSRLPVSMVMADIDHFKVINDSFGHDFGDRVLADLAEILSEVLRGQDLLARWGGEEFLIVQPETDDVECRASLERIRQALAGHEVDFGRKKIRFTLSFGYHTVFDGNLEFESFLKIADENLYKAKGAGRDCVVGSAGPRPKKDPSL